MTENELKLSIKKSLRNGLLLIGVSVLPLFGLILRLTDSLPKTNSDKKLNFISDIAYALSPKISLTQDVIDIFKGKDINMFNTQNVIAFIIILVFTVGCFNIKSWSQKSDYLAKLKKEVSDEKIKQDIREQ